MGYANLIKSGGGGITSDDVTVTRAEVLEGKTTITADSEDEIVEGTFMSDATLNNANQLLSGQVAYSRTGIRYEGNVASMNGGTYTPGTSAQTISCAGRKMNSNVIINAIPSSYLNLTSGQVTF